MSKQITLTDYYAYLEKKGLSKSTVATYRSSINRFVAWLEQKEAHEMADGGLTALQKGVSKTYPTVQKNSRKRSEIKSRNYQPYHSSFKAVLLMDVSK